MQADSADFIAAMRRFPAAVNIITTGDGAARAGFTATAVMSLTAEPPQIGVAVNRSVTGLPALRANGSFCVNTLAAHQAELAGRFAGKVKGAERFRTGDWIALTTGAPALADALVTFDCRVVQEIEFSSHLLLVGQVEALRGPQDLKPLLYVEGNWASLLPSVAFDPMDAVQSTLAVLEETQAERAEPNAQLDGVIRKLTRFYIDRQVDTRDHLSAEQYVAPEQLADVNAARKAFDEQIADLLGRGVEKGQFQVEDPKLTAFAISGMVAWVHRWYRPHGRLTPEEIGDRLARLVARMVSGSDGAGEAAARPPLQGNG